MICVRNIGKQHSPIAMEYPGYTPVRHPQLLPNILPPGVSDTLVNRLHLEAGILPTTIEATETLLAVAGFPPGTRQVLEGMLDGLVKEHGEGRIPWAGAKPELLQNTDRVILFPIPGTDLGIRVFPGDLHPRDGMFFFDLYDRTRRVAVNSPPSFSYQVLRPVKNEDLLSMEEDAGIAREAIKPGEERFGVPEGIRCCLKRDGEQDFFFLIPEHPKVRLDDQRFATAIPFL
ncbi:hypothetical protein C8R47DRAFT_1153502 [Mycena vitilis]|nr:hypothetical protein C8R47DRAFT_1153502 [Mycena vitilis]